MTKNLEERIARHNAGREKTTRPYVPFSLLFYEEVSDRIEARVKEKYWKSGIGKEKLRAMKDNL